MDIQDFENLLLYYGRSEFFHTMQKFALDGLAKYPTHIAFRLYNGIALVLGNRMQEGIRELNPLKNDAELGVGTVKALIYAHNRCSVVDREAIQILEQRMREDRANVNANGFYYGAVFLFLTKNFTKAREYIDKCLRINSDHESAIVLKAWIDMLQYNANVSGNVMHTLEQILTNSKSIDATLALVRFFQLRGQFENANSTLIKLSIKYPQLNIPLVVKMETQLAALDWERAYETALRIINLDPTNIAALRIKAYMLVVREGNVKGGISTLQQLLVATDRVESGNSKLLLEICKLFARISSRNAEMLALTLRFIDKLIQANPTSVECIVELGNQRMLLGNINEASICYRSATKIEHNNYDALCGLTLCQLLKNGNSDEISQQVEFLDNLQPGDLDPLLLLIKAKATNVSEEAIALLNKAIDRHMGELEGTLYGYEYFLKLDPDFLLQVAKELLRHSPLQMNVKQGINLMQDAVHISLKHCISILDVILKFCPAHIHANYIRAEVHFLCAETNFAHSLLQRIINEIDSTYTDAYLLLAQIQIQNQQYTKALQYLEMALSVNFAVRDDPKYFLLLGIGQRQQQQYSEAQKSFISAMHILGKDITTDSRIPVKKRDQNFLIDNFTVADKVTLYLELISTYKDMGDTQGVYESERLLQSAMEEFNNTTEEGRLIIAHAEFMLQNSNVKKAIELLSAIQPGQSYYIQAKTHLANIFLHNRKDRVAFASCFNQLVESCPEPQSYLLLGEAYFSIQEPDLAVDAYRKAFEINPQDSHLANKLGRAFVKTHQYTKAITFYQHAIKSHSSLSLNLAELYLKLKQYKNAQEILNESEDKKEIDLLDTDSLQLRTKRLLLLARVHEKAGNNDLTLDSLKKAKENQYIIHKRASIHQAGKLHDHYKMLSKICLLIAQHCTNVRNTEMALANFKECLKYDPNDIEVLKPLSRVYMQMNAMDLCRDVCLQILQIDSNNEAASVMMADLSFRKMDFENAAYHFSQLLLTQPCYWTALARLIEVMRRSGTLADATLFLQKAEQSLTNSDLSPGLNYCRALYDWYNGNPNGALRSFNAARRDSEWGPQAIFNMIEICINPDGDIPNGNELLEPDDNGELSDARVIALKTADRLLKELRPRPTVMSNEAINHRLLKNFLKLASKQKFQIDSALQDFIELANREDLQGSVGPVLGMATAFVLTKQTQRAKNCLKRLARTTWSFEEAEYLERSWLLLADIYISSNKWDVADSLVGKVLEHNKSCAKAHELAGYIAEKSQLYRDASKHYRNAWNCYGKSKPHIGYKLAYNFMKTKQYAEAIEICQQVLKLHSDYGIIRKDILDKCRNHLRT
ncbi:tetratricopeptide repeat protein 21B [Stomoxys calcitrans]|uniref:tetratricopeptide repeat protein 21B n=1 Tax=Stomoxys calcitrans TaxID=35570 RepID=UPI0027E3ACD1|nr:tetratricopeptide repeat protein 21B [Stomoxys calcitrans]XP_059219459.1 tetratricopeptide repeat protein 21B [Stomoxys calcitrans]